MSGLALRRKGGNRKSGHSGSLIDFLSFVIVQKLSAFIVFCAQFSSKTFHHSMSGRSNYGNLLCIVKKSFRHGVLMFFLQLPFEFISQSAKGHIEP